jgi:hypothetical protein
MTRRFVSIIGSVRIGKTAVAVSVAQLQMIVTATGEFVVPSL